MEQNLHQQVDYYSRQLKLPSFRESYVELAKQAAKDKLCHEEYLLKLMLLEHDERIIRRKKQRVRRACFPCQKLLQDLIGKELPQDGADQLPGLERLDFIPDGQNLILVGNPGTGKTHIATALGIKACSNGFTVLFTTVPRLATQIIEPRSAKSLRQLENRFEEV